MWFHSEEMVTVPELNLGVFIATNTDTGFRLAQGLPRRIVERFYAPPQPATRPGSPSLAGQQAVYDGTYLTTRRPYNGLEQFIFLIIGQVKIRVAGDGRLIVFGRDGAQALGSGRDERLLFIQADGPETGAFQIERGRAVRWLTPLATTSSASGRCGRPVS